jgi:subtilisin family serine protease
VLALLAGRPDSDTPGLIPEAKFFLANVFFDAGNGETITDTVSLLKSLEWMNASQTKVVNMSFSGPQDDLLQARLKLLRARGVVFTAAAGNEGPAAFPVYPAAYPEVIAVTAVTEDRRVYPSANRGPYIDVAAPGVRIWTALPDGREGYRTGTSFATPFATAVLALQQPTLMYEPKDELLDHLNLLRLGAGQHDPIYGRGLLQAPAECSGGHPPASNLAPLRSSIAQ